MYNKYSQSRVKTFEKHIDLNHFVWASLATILCFAAGLSQALASSHSAYQNQNSMISNAQAKTVGYHLAWVERLSGIAEDAFDEDHPQLARRVWTALAEQGHAEAAYKLGMMYDMGLGADRDAVIAVAWYRLAAQGGNIHAQHNLAVAYANGDGVEMNIDHAMHWWQQAASSGNGDSQYNLGIVYAMGVHGIQKNIDEAKKWWRKAAIDGDPMAQYNLGTIYANGENQVKSYCEAMRWWEKSAQKGIQQATWALEIIKTRQDFLACW